MFGVTKAIKACAKKLKWWERSVFKKDQTSLKQKEQLERLENGREMLMFPMNAEN